MPILALGPDGKIYATSGDSTVGTGFGYKPERVEEGDLTLGNAYLKAQNRRSSEGLKNHHQQSKLDAMDAGIARASRINRQKQKARLQRESELNENADLQDALKRRALQMGCPCDYSTPLDGNVMSANGMTGFNGMSRDQQTIHNAVTGRGRSTAYAVDPEEMKQAQHRADAQRILHLKARR